MLLSDASAAALSRDRIAFAVNFELVAITVLVTTHLILLALFLVRFIFVEGSLSGLLGCLLLLLFTLASVLLLNQHHLACVGIQVKVEVRPLFEVIVAIRYEIGLLLYFLYFIKVAF